MVDRLPTWLRPECLDRLDRLVGLLEEVPEQRDVRLLGVPGTAPREARGRPPSPVRAPRRRGRRARGGSRQVRWSGSRVRSISEKSTTSATARRRGRGDGGARPRPAGGSSKASFTSENRSADQVWATSRGPVSPAASMEKRSASTSLTPTVTGSMPRRSQARSRKDSPATIRTVTLGSARRSSTAVSSTIGDPGTP